MDLNTLKRKVALVKDKIPYELQKQLEDCKDFTQWEEILNRDIRNNGLKMETDWLYSLLPKNTSSIVWQIPTKPRH